MLGPKLPKKLFNQPLKFIFEQIKAQREYATKKKKSLWQMYYFDLKTFENQRMKKKALKTGNKLSF